MDLSTGSPARVGITLSRDFIALERDEVFQLRLIPSRDFTQTNEFLYDDTLNITIIDNDGKINTKF